jgi:hypothetical protein
MPFCVRTLDPPPSGTLGRPVAPFPAADHKYLHSSKWAGGLLQHPPAASGFDGFSSALVIDNPDPNNPITATIDYFDYNGVNVLTRTVSIAKDGHYTEAATPLDPARARVAGAARRDEAGALVGRALQRGAEQRLDPRPARRRGARRPLHRAPPTRRR